MSLHLKTKPSSNEEVLYKFYTRIANLAIPEHKHVQ